MNTRILFLKVFLYVFFFMGNAVYAIEAEYEIESAGQGAQGTYLVKVTTTIGKNESPENILRLCAVHGVLFRGLSSSSSYETAKKPLAGSAVVESQNADYFTAFFAENGPYKQYSSLVPSTLERVKLSRKEYRISAVMLVQKDQLRIDLENGGVLKKLDSIF